MVNGKKHSVWFVPTGMNGLPQNVLLNFRLEFRKLTLPFAFLPDSWTLESVIQLKESGLR